MTVTGQGSELDDDEVLVSSLRELGLRFLGPTPGEYQKSSDLSTREVLRRLILHNQPRMRLALIPLLILNPDLAPEIQMLVQQLPDSAGKELQALYTAAVYLQAFWRTRLNFYFGNFTLLPDLYSRSLQLPSSQERHGKTGLHALASWHSDLSPFPTNRLASYHKMMNLLFKQLKTESRRHEPATPVDRQRIETFLQGLGRRFRHPGRVYLVGGTTMVYEGFRGLTIDIDLAFEVSQEWHANFIDTIRNLANREFCMANPPDS